MNEPIAERAIGVLFDVRAGDFHATKELDPGSVPLVSCGDTDNGVMGYFDIPHDQTYRNAVTVAFNGSWPLLSKFHAYEFGAKDDVAVLLAKEPLAQETLIYVAAMLNRMTWRYSYGRKCFRQKLENVKILIPVTEDGRIDEERIAEFYRTAFDSVQNTLGKQFQNWGAVAGDSAAVD